MMRDWSKRFIAVLLAVALTLSNFPDTFFSEIMDIFSINMTVKAEDETGSGETGTSSNDAGSVAETEDETDAEETSTELVVAVEVEDTEEEAGNMLTATQATTTVQSQLDALNDAGTVTETTITLTADTTEDILVYGGLNVIIDLNGHTITPAGDASSAITVYGTLTLKDSSAEGTGTLSNEGTSLTNIRGVDVVQNGKFTLESGTITGFSVTGNGGGVMVENNGTFVMTGGTIDENYASNYGGGVFFYDADQIADITGGTISGNFAGISGGGLAANITSGTITLQSGLTISGNEAATYGGGVYFANALTTLTIKSTISENTAGTAGGGVYFGSTITTLSIEGATIDGNISAGAGGGCYFAAKVTSAEIKDNASISSNTAAGNGGGLWFTSGTSLILTNGTISGNTIEASGALYGAGIYLNSASGTRSNFTSTGGTISGNTIKSDGSANSYGAGVYIYRYATLKMENTVISGNTGATYGGGIAIDQYAQSITLTDLTVSKNQANASSTASSGYGGGLYVAANSACTVTVSGGTWSGNTADYYGGAIYVTTASSYLVIGDAAKIDGNTAYNAGGGIYTEGYLTLAGGDSKDTAVVICSNVATSGVGGGVYSSTSNSPAITSTGYVDVYLNSAGTNGGGLCVNAGGMDLSGYITIHNNYSTGTNYGGAGLYAGSNTTGTIWLHEGVYIYENTSNLHGGGVYSRYGLKIDDGVYIYDNYAGSNGGGVEALTLDMSGGEIHDNNAANGGGVYIVQGTSGSVNPESRISGGKIYNNTARTGSGGGIYTNSYPNKLYIEGDVKIYDNSAYSYGGGVYVTDLFSFSGGIITGNTAQRGGGVYIVGYKGQSATIEISDTDSGIIYDNTATTVNYGNDVALGFNSASVSSDNSTNNAYPLLTMGAANTFTDSANGVTGVSWYDEVADSTNEASFSTYITTSTQQAGQYYTLVYSTSKVVAEVWDTTLNDGAGGYKTFSTVQAAVDEVESNSSIYGTEGSTDGTITIIMLDDSREDVTIPTGVSVTLDLAGCTLTGLKKSVITVDSGATLVIDDSSTEGTGLITGGDGTVTSGTDSYGGGLYISGSVTFNGGTISGNVAKYGGGVYVAYGGTFTLDGGTITANTATSTGGGLYVYGGASGTYKTSDPNFVMTSGYITANTGGSGGGIYIYVYANIEISGGSITNNTATATTSVGGGIYIYSQTLFTMTGGLVTGNTAVTGGGIYSLNVNSNLTFSDDARIYGNTATSNTANDIYATFSNTTSGTAGNGSISVLAASSMGNDAYNSWFDYYGVDNSTYPCYYTNTISAEKENHIFALTATYYSGGNVAYIPNTGVQYSTLQGAINAAVDGDTIYLLCDVKESVKVTGKETITVDLNGYTIYSTGAYGFYVEYNTTYTNLTIQSTSSDPYTNASSDAAGIIKPAESNSNYFPRGIYVYGKADYNISLTIGSVEITGFGNKEQADVTGTSSYNGGAIYTTGGYNKVTLTGSAKITDSYAYQGGGIYMTGYNIYLTIEGGVEISGNTAYQGGGICFNASGDYTSTTAVEEEVVTIGEATISGNTAVNSAGGLYIIGWNSTSNTSDGSWPKVTMTKTIVSENTSETEVGGAYFIRVSQATLTECEIKDNIAATQYGGMRIDASTSGVNAFYTITNSYFTGNISGTNYAGLTVSTGVANISDCTFTDNISTTGCAALYLNTVASGSTVNDCDFTDNESTTSGYIVYITSSYVTVSDMIVKNNKTATNTGAVCVHANSSTIQGEVNITDSDISYNSGYGLDLYLQNDKGEIVTVSKTTITYNSGYGIQMRQSNNHQVVRDKFVLNIEDGTEVAYNGNTGIYANGYGTINIKGGEISGNTAASYGGGVYAAYTNFNMSGGEIYDNTATYGGGVYLLESTDTYSGGKYNSTVETDTISGGKIYGNTSTYTSTSSTATGGGGGIYVGDYDSLNMTGGSVTDNTAALYGGGVYLSGRYTTFELAEGLDTVGQVYDNSAKLGQDVYVYYNSTYAGSTSLGLVIASSMFAADEGKTGVGWLNESTNAVTKTAISYSPVKKSYPLTLEYDTGEVVAVIWDAINEKYQTFTSVQAAVDALYDDYNDGSGYYYTTEISDPEIILIDDATGNVDIESGLTLTINLNGYTLKGLSTAITSAGYLTIKDVQYTTGDDTTSDTYCAHYSALLTAVKENIDADATSVGAGTDSTGTITGTAGYLGGGVYVNGGTVTMISGQIANCTAGGNSSGLDYGGAGVYIYNGTFTLKGTASINNCTTNSYGSAVYVDGVAAKFILEGEAVIEENSANYGTVFVNYGSFTMTAGTIQNNSATNYGGGVYVYQSDAKATITAGTITGNTATNRGGGIYMNNGTVNLSGTAQITNNSTTASYSSTILNGAGGGIFVNNGTLNIKSNAVISGNTAIRGAGIYQNGGTINMGGGQITGNTASLGGGLAQNPSNSGVFTLTGGVLCDNTSSLSGAGNDVYSINESGSTLKSTVTLMPAVDMDYVSEGYGVAGLYNAWRDDDYTGSTYISETILGGMYITGQINSSSGLQLTAASYGDTEPTEETTSTYVVTSLVVTSITDGASTFDETDGIAYNSNGSYDTWHGSNDEGGETYDLEKNPTAATWTAGNDSSASNGLVRTYDKVTYSLRVTYEEPNGEGKETDTNVICVKATLPLSESEAEFDKDSLKDYDSYEITDYDTYQVLEAYKTVTGSGAPSCSVGIKVKGMKNADLIKPTFDAWIVGNSDNVKTHPSTTPTAVTVSAAGMYDITLVRNSELSYTGYFNLLTGEETTEQAYEDAGGENQTNIIYGTMLGYGITLSMRNADSNKGKLGMESPSDTISFDLSFTGDLYLDGEEIDEDVAPYIWAYKENKNTAYGINLGGTAKDFNMNWNDEDDIASTTQYAYNAAPFNTGNNDYSCYYGGSWTASGSQPGSNDTSTTVSFKITNYAIDTSFDDINPSKCSDNETATYFTGNSIKPFSAGYIQVIFPINTTKVKGETGYLSIEMQSIASDLVIKDASGATVDGKDVSDSTDSDLVSFVKYYGETYASYATGEVYYLNNYVSTTTGLYIASGDGQILVKTNYFNDSVNAEMTGENGNGSTGIGTVVYGGGSVHFSSNTYDTTEEGSVRENKEIDTEAGDNVLEKDYLTAFNILQKFDASAYTVDALDVDPIVDYECNTGNTQIYDSSNTLIFEITTTESAASWSADRTTTYYLTILYAAKTNGYNWTYLEDDQGYYTPTKDMDDTTEEDLIYFTSLQDLYDYFGYDDETGEPNGYCVGILYEFRDCCIRTDREVAATVRLNVTNDFDNAGKTFCTTNDVRGWTTYRPLYKAIFKDSSENLEDYLYNFSWMDCVNSDLSTDTITVYGYADGEAHDADAKKAYQEAEYTITGYENAQYTGYKYDNYAVLETYEAGYVQTQYDESGWMVGSTHTGWYEGNTLLLYTMESGIAIDVTEKEAGSSTSKTTYSLGSERTVSYVVTPTIAESSSVSNELVSNGTQATTVTITITLDRYLNLDDGSISFDYSKSDYEEGELTWNIEVSQDLDSNPNEEDSTYGVTTITLTTSVTDITKVLPTINYTCNIGVPGAANDPLEPTEKETKLTAVAAISVEYEEIGKISTYAKEAEITITAIREDSDNIWLDGDGKKELGEDIVFTVNYRNTGDKANSIELVDVLPYMGDGDDGRLSNGGVSSSFTGGYQVESITLTFLDSSDYQKFLDYGALIYKTGVKYDDDGSDQQTIYTELLGDGATALYLGSNFSSSGITFSGDSSSSILTAVTGTYTVTFTITDTLKSTLTQLATDDGGIAFYVYLPSVTNSEVTKNASGAVTSVDVDKKVQIAFTLSPDKTESGETVLITDGQSETQEGGNVYYDNAFYRLASNTANTPVTSNLGNAQVISRELTGIAWLDMDHDGLYNESSESTESKQTLENIDVSLYSTYAPEDQAGWANNNGKVTKVEDYESVTGDTRWVQTVDGTTIALAATTLDIDSKTVTLYPVIDVLGNLVVPTVTDDSGKYSFVHLAATDDDDVGTGIDPEELYVIFQDDITTVYTVNDGDDTTTDETPMSYGQLSVTLYDSSWKDETAARNISQAYYGSSTSTSGSPSQLQLAYVNEITMPALEEIAEEKYIKSNVNSGYYYRELTVEKIWQNMLSGVDDVEEGTKVTVTVTGTSKGIDGTSGNNYTYDNTYVFTQTDENSASGFDGTVTAEYTENHSSIGFETITVSGAGTQASSASKTTSGYSVPSLTVGIENDTTTGLDTITWSLGTIALQAEDNNGVITYDLSSFTETVPTDDPPYTKSLTGFVKETEVIQEEDDSTSSEAWKSKLTARVTNTQILYELNLSKISSSSDGNGNILYLAGAEFTLYKDKDCTDVYKIATSAGADPDDNIGEILFSYLKPGTYYLKETKAPSGYELNQGVWEITIEFNDSTSISSFTIKLIKDQETGETISDGEYTKVDAIIAGTAAKEYIVNKYKSDGSEGTDETDTALYSISFEIKNEVIYSLPSIGRGGIGWITLGGIALMLLAVWLLLRGKEKNKIQE